MSRRQSKHNFLNEIMISILTFFLKQILEKMLENVSHIGLIAKKIWSAQLKKSTWDGRNVFSLGYD